MKRLYFVFIFSFLFSKIVSAQTFGNEWINFSQKYLKIQITQDGIYRIDSTAISNALNSVGTSLLTVDARNFQLFHNGQEQYIFLAGDSDGVFNATDFLEFYGKRNDGEMDSSLYGGRTNQLNPFVNLFSDTAIYFLTWNASLANRRITNPNDTSFSSYTPAPYFTDEEDYFSNSEYLPGVENSLGMSDGAFIPSEGIYDAEFYFGQTKTVNVNTYYAYPIGNAVIKVKIGSHSNDWTVSNDNHIQIIGPGISFDTIYDGYSVASYNFARPTLFLSNTITPISISSINSNGAASDGGTAIAYLTLSYPHTFNMENRSVKNGFLPDNLSGPKALMPIANMGGSGPVYVYDFFNHQRITTVFSGGIWQALVANGNGTEKAFSVFQENSVQQITSFIPVNGNGTFTNFSLQSADSVFAIVTPASLISVATDYKTYRSSVAGGNRNVVVANISELYDQFSYGIGEDPLAIRNFSNFMIQTYTSPPGHLLLLGKSMSETYARYGSYAQNLVPTFGYPPCDNFLTAGLNGTRWEPAIPTGRIAAKDSVEARWYLNKVIGYENQQPAEWMKQVLHFGGGTSAQEQFQYKTYLNGFKQTIEDTLFGGNVTSYFKTSSAPIQINQSDSLRQQIENGVSMMTFFGHASGTGFDQSIDDPSTYNNFNKYPFLIANSCYAGDIHSPGISSSEAFTLINQKGTIGYLASVGIGVPNYLDIYSANVYTAIGKTRYGKSVGECIQWAIAQNETMLSVDTFVMKVTSAEMTLEGDPAIIINSFPKPDYEISNADVWFDQLTNPDSVFIYAKVTNIGRAINHTFVCRMVRTFPNGTTDTVSEFLNAPKYRDTLRFDIPVDFQKGIGLNKIKIWVDYFGAIDELREDNNTTQPDVDLFIQGSAIIPIYPYEFEVIPTDTITLKASTVNPMEATKIYRLEIDTTDLFNSPFKQTTTITSAGGVVTWKPTLMNTDSMVYFWRVSPDSILSTDNFLWRQSSFQYINTQTGWGQDHIFQFTNDIYQYAKLNRPSRRFDFVNDVKTLSVKNGLYFTGVPWNESWYKINGATEAIFSCTAGFGGEGVSVAVINPYTGLPRNYNDTLVGQEPLGYWDCVGANQVLNAFDFFDTDNFNQQKLADFLDSVPNGYRLLVYSQDYSANSRTPYIPALQTAFANFGCDTVGTSMVPDSVSFISWGVQGGAPGSATEVIGANKSSVITLNDVYQTNWNFGFVESPVIGPAQSWGSFHWREHADESPISYDSTAVEVWGITAAGLKTRIISFPKDSEDVMDLGTIVDANQYPYLQLVCRMRDDSNHTPPQLDHWHVLYTPYPDAAINPPLAFSFHADTLQEGDKAKLVVGIQNVTPWSFNDSLLLTYWIVDNNRVKHLLPQKLRMPLLTGYSWFADTLIVNTNGYPGANELWVEVNPVGDVNSLFEQTHFNNVLMIPFHVRTDNINPLLDVTFDGVHIMDKDIVSGKPNILISLKDENQFLALNDTTDFKIFLRKPSQSVAQLIPWGPDIIFTPAVLPHNSCKILFNPLCSEDGIYELIVQAKDRSNNQSGIIDYHITFEVINKSTITDILNYPNPFTTSTQFVFTLTGNEVPQLFTIQIMTVTGKVVREINRDEIGDLHIGRNVTAYAWDGRDMFGDQLANGVYLYRVITRIDGNTIDHRESGADNYITHGFGKMYLMR